MEPSLAKWHEGHKYMWDGAVYEKKDDAEAKMKEYENDEFETLLVEEEGKFLVYTRRVVTEVVVDDGAGD